MLKIAGGVFLGILGFFIVLNIPNWLAESREDSARSVIFHLTPDAVIAHCGKPISDQSETLPTNTPNDLLLTRDLSYKNDVGTVVLHFLNVSKEAGSKERFWSMNSMEDSLGVIRYDTYESKLNALPCLAGPK